MEAANTAPSTSKVIIQCTDPDNLLETFDARLSARTPLQNLHWKSPTRPLRSIPSLNVSLVRKDPSQNGTHSTARRHQIPGLRETPYLKLYLLRCDDRESYKESARKEIKQWIKENTLEKESKSALKKQEHHDAYEWMIVHVVIPGTTAASQPKSSKHISLETTDSTDSVNSKSKWTAKSTSTIFDKLRADFSNSKAAIPRVTQVRLTEQGKPPGALSPAEVEEQWQDLVDNLKAAILQSFDTRVSQYEEDIREKENQRSLPGWNFCTFFVLKEGLARGFENVGLLDDALAVYRELEIGLDLVVKDAHEQDEVEGGGALLSYSKDLKTVIRIALDSVQDSSEPVTNGQPGPLNLRNLLDSNKDKSPLNIEDDKYRDLILKNQVSAFELRAYMFKKKMEILLRQAKLPETSRANATSTRIDLSIVADFAEMALNFVNLGAREYRSNLYAAWGGRLSGSERATQRTVIGNLVATWTWTTVMHILARIAPLLSKEIVPFDKPVDFVLGDLVREPVEEEPEKRAHSQDRRPISSTRSSPDRGLRSQSLPRPISVSKDSLDIPAHQPKSLPRPGLDRLCGWAAQLLLLARTVLEQLEATQTWSESLRKFELNGQPQRKKKLNRLSSYGPSALLNGSASNGDSNPTVEDKLLCLDSNTLRNACSSRESFMGYYRLLSAFASQLNHTAGYLRALDQVLFDLAEVAYSSDEKLVAARYLSKALGPPLKSDGASQHSLALAMYAECLEVADRPHEYVQCLLACLQSSSTDHSISASQLYFDKLVKIATNVEPVQVPLGAILQVSDTDKSITHLEDRDGFNFSIQVKSTLRASLRTKEPAKLYLFSTGANEPGQLVLHGPTEIELDAKPASLTFRSAINTQGWYEVDRLELEIGNLLFVHRFQQDSGEGLSMRLRKHQVPSVMVYPRFDAVSLEIMPSTSIVLGETKKLSLVLHAGNVEMSCCKIRLRAASAGLRLNLHESTSLSSLNIIREKESSVLELDDVDPKTSVAVEIPYTLESASDPSIVVKCEVKYDMQGDSFSFFKTCSTDVILPLSVNVQDIHRSSHWFSKFLIRPATLVPIVLWGCSIDDDSGTEVESGNDFNEPLMVFPHQPATWTVRLRQTDAQQDRRLRFNVRYQCLDELILNSLKRHLASALNQTPYAQPGSLLSTHLVQTIRNGWTEQDLEVAGLTQGIEMWRMQDLDWPSVLCAFDPNTKEKIRLWIEQWHSTISTVPIDMNQAPVRLLKLSVDLPSRPPVVETGFRLQSGSSIVPVGQPLVSELTFGTIVRGHEINAQELDLSFELFAPSEAWLIGGRKKGSFRATTEEMSLRVILFPQRTGTLLLPAIDVRCRRRDQSSASGWVDVVVDVHNRTLSKTLQVTPDLRSTTIGLMSAEGEQVSSGVMVDSQSRGPRT